MTSLSTPHSPKRRHPLAGVVVLLLLLAVAIVLVSRFAPVSGLRADLSELGRAFVHRSIPAGVFPDPRRQVRPPN